MIIVHMGNQKKWIEKSIGRQCRSEKPRYWELERNKSHNFLITLNIMHFLCLCGI